LPRPVENGGGWLPALKSSHREREGRPCGVIIPRYINAVKGFEDKNFVSGFYFFADARQELYSHAFQMAGFGNQFREKVRTEIPYAFHITAQGECLPRSDNYVKLDPQKKDAWGIPALHINASYGENERTMAKTMRIKVNEILDALKVEERTSPSDQLSPFGKNIHECGTARMGNDPKKSVLNKFNQVHEAKNVFVTDGASFVTQGCYEPTLTIMALSVRAADYIAHEYKRGNL
jgi:choline dehydrogenase-like flavoprotein